MRDCYSANPLRAHADLMPFDIRRPGAWLLTRIEVADDDVDGSPLRGRGIARGLMARVLADADAEGAAIYLVIDPDGTGLDEDQLREWYRRLGFVKDPTIDSDVTMVREPR